MSIYKNSIVCALLFSVNLLFGRLTVLDKTPRSVELLSTHEMRFCYISFVKIDGIQYIIKQKKSDCIRKIVSVVRDAVTAHVVEESFGIGLAHQVDIIPAGKSFPGKIRTDWPATIHTIAPGRMIKAQDSYFDGMKIKQADVGFMPSMLEWMILHPTLVKMVAWDTFLCNHDRHRGNLFYDPTTDSLCAIDMDSSWKYNLCKLGCNNFIKMLHDKKLKLSKKEIIALMLYKNYLEFLVDKYQPEDILKLYDDFACKAGFVEGAKIYTEKVASDIESNRKMIVDSYEDAKKLLHIMERLIERIKKGVLKNSQARIKNHLTPVS